MRRRFFADAGFLATRYRLGPDAVLDHLETARRALPGRVAINSIWIDDLLLAAACSRNIAIAWTDLATHLEPALRRAAASRLPPADAAAFVAVFRRSLEQTTLDAVMPDRRGGPPSLRAFAGQRSLESWLVERLLAQLDWTSSPRVPAPASSRGRGLDSGT